MQYTVLWAPYESAARLHYDRFNRFRRTYGRDRHTDRHTYGMSHRVDLLHNLCLRRTLRPALQSLEIQWVK